MAKKHSKTPKKAWDNEEDNLLKQYYGNITIIAYRKLTTKKTPGDTITFREAEITIIDIE